MRRMEDDIQRDLGHSGRRRDHEKAWRAGIGRARASSPDGVAFGADFPRHDASLLPVGKALGLYQLGRDRGSDRDGDARQSQSCEMHFSLLEKH